MMIKDDMTRPTGKLAAQHHVYSHIIMMNNAILLYCLRKETLSFSPGIPSLPTKNIPYFNKIDLHFDLFTITQQIMR